LRCREYAKQYRLRHPEKVKETKAKYYASEKGKACKKREEIAYVISGKREAAEKRRAKRPLSQARKDARKRWRNKNKHYYAADRAHRRMLSRTTLSVLHKREIEEIYLLCSKMPGYQVDHIVPVKGKNVSGLHVPWNLQIILQTENRSKSNKVIEHDY